MATKKSHPKAVPSRPAASQPGDAHPPESRRKPPPPTVSGRWLLGAAGVSLAAAAACGWLTLCLLFWQGSWQLLYHPIAAVTRTPASHAVPFDPVAFAATEAGEPRLKGWWIPAAPDARFTRYTVLYLHGQNGNLGDTVDALAALHSLGVNILAFDYRGYGQSQFVHPSEARWREDADWALNYLTATRHIAAGSILLDGRELGANLAIELAATHPELAGVVLESPLASPVEAIFNDPRAALVPAHWLMRDRFQADQAAALLRIPSLWLVETPDTSASPGSAKAPPGYAQVQSKKMIVWLPSGAGSGPAFANAFARWLDDQRAK
ncbi:MAG: alpha/beta fold hydrolase [Terracidiphilus sp.]